MSYLRPMILREKYFASIEAETQRLFDDLIYLPLLRLFAKPVDEIHNRAADALLDAVREGVVYYADGQFRGNFSSSISKALRALGAVYNARSSTWSFPLGDMPPEVLFAQADADARWSALRGAFIRTLDDMQIASIDRHSRTKEKYSQSIDWMEGDFQKTVKAISIPIQLTPAQRGIISQEWGQNLDLYIKDWAAENILKLREEVQEHAFRGGRAEGMVKTLQQNYGVSKRKAQFLARQETSLLMSKFKETRYKDMGISKFKWSGANDERERPDHRALNGKIFSYDDPPVTNQRTGARNNPGGDYGCRCIDIPWVD